MKNFGTINACGYIWHTTGSGKTLTSFKTARLATELDYIDKVIFVVDRKDLDYQTMKEYQNSNQIQLMVAIIQKNSNVVLRRMMIELLSQLFKS